VIDDEDGEAEVVALCHETHAPLISAAPDLLAALEAVLFSAEALLDDLESQDGWRADPESFGVARAAIAKAKGSTP
jgi:hypothetical protein